MKRFLQIAQLGNTILRETAKPIENIQSQEIQDLISDMITTLEDSGGVGLAAPQINQSKRIFIISSHANKKQPNSVEMEPTAIINPEIIEYSKEVEKGWEGCLSIPGLMGNVPRYKNITVRYQDKDGNKKEEKFTGFLARVFQHENDHLDGVVYLDRLENIKDIITEKEYYKLRSKKK